MPVAGEVALAALPPTNIVPVPGASAAAICPLQLDVHIDLSLCVRRATSDAALELADRLPDPALDASLGRLGSAWFSLGE